MEIYIAPEILALIADFLGAQSLYCFYLASLDFSESEDIQKDLADLIVFYCTRKDSCYYSFESDTPSHYRNVLWEFAFPIGMEKDRLDIEKIRLSSEYKRRIEKAMLPIYIRIVEPELFTCDCNARILTGSIEQARKAFRNKSLRAYCNAFLLGDEEILELMLQEEKQCEEPNWVNIIQAAISFPPALQNFNRVLASIENIRIHLFNYDWEEILRACCVKTVDIEVVKIICSRYYTHVPDNIKLEYLEKAACSGSLEYFQFFELKCSMSINKFVQYYRHRLQIAIRYGHLHIMKYIEEVFQKKNRWHNIGPADLMNVAIRYGHLSIVKYLQEKTGIIRGDIAQVMKEFGVMAAIGSGHVDCVRYVLDQSQPLRINKELRKKGFKEMTEEELEEAMEDHKKESSVRTAIRTASFYPDLMNLETVQAIFEKFRDFIDPFSLLLNAITANNREIYRFCRNRIDLETLSQKNNLRRIFTAIIHYDYVELFVYVKCDLSRYLSNFQAIWDKIETSLIWNKFPKYRAVKLLKYYFQEILLTQKEREDYFLSILSSETNHHLLVTSCSFIEILCGYIPNLRVLIENPSANSYVKEYIQRHILREF